VLGRQVAVAFRVRTEVTEYLAVDNIGKKPDSQ
jgi:hypothetical protein